MEAKVFIIYVHLLCEQKSSQKNTELEKPFLESVSGKYHFSALNLHHLAQTLHSDTCRGRKCKKCSKWVLGYFQVFCLRSSPLLVFVIPFKWLYMHFNTDCFPWSWISLLIIKISSTIGIKLMLHQQCNLVFSLILLVLHL